MGERELVQLGNTETCPFKLRKICKSNSEVGVITVLKACDRNYIWVRCICCENGDTSLSTGGTTSAGMVFMLVI